MHTSLSFLQEKRNIVFMQELQDLFALMIGSNRKFVDPSAALDLLKGAFRSPEEQQVQEVLILVLPQLWSLR